MENSDIIKLLRPKLINMMLAALPGMVIRVGGKRDDGERGKKWLAIFIGFIMLSSVIGYVFLSNPSTKVVTDFHHAGLTFEQMQDGTYTATMGGNQVDFFYKPEDVADINISGPVVKKISESEAIYITYYWNSTFAQDMALFQLDFSTLLLERNNVYAQSAFTLPSPVSASAVVTCGNATPFIPVLVLQEGANNALEVMTSNPNCIVLNATSGVSFRRTADKLKYTILDSGPG